MRVLVTGGAGFIGSHVVDHALRAGHEVAVLDNLSTGRRENVPAAARLYVADVRDRERTFEVMRDFAPQAVSHQAAQASVPSSIRDPRADAEVNLMGGLNVLDACTDKVSVERVVFASTGGAIAGEVPPGSKARESDPPSPLSPYAIHKLAFEQLLGVYARHRGISVNVLRYANVYGPRQDPHGEAGVVAIFSEAVMQGRPLRINALRTPGDGGCLRDYVFVTDVARLNALALEGKVSEPVVHAATGTATSTLELAKTIMQAEGKSVDIGDAPPRAGDIGRSVLDPSLMLRYVGQTVGLAQGLKQTLEWMHGKL